MAKIEKEIKILNHVEDITRFVEEYAKHKKRVGHINMHFSIGNTTAKFRIDIPAKSNGYVFTLITKNKIQDKKAKYPMKKEVETELSIDDFERMLKILPKHFKEKGIKYYYIKKYRYTKFSNITFVKDFTIDICEFDTSLPTNIRKDICRDKYPCIHDMLDKTEDVAKKMIYANKYVEVETLEKGISTDTFVKDMLTKFKKFDLPTKEMKLTAKGISSLMVSNLNKYNKAHEILKDDSSKKKKEKKEKKKG